MNRLSFVLLVTLALSNFTACLKSENTTQAYRIAQRSQLIGGPRALGEVGDWMIENDQVRFIIQDKGFSRGFGVFGGSLIDADLVRADAKLGDSEGGGGRDNFGEMFSAFFLEAMEPVDVFSPNDPTGSTGEGRLDAIEVTQSGEDGVAELTVRALGSDFIGLTAPINDGLLGERDLLYITRYRLRPGAKHLEIETTVHNVAFPDRELSLPNEFLGISVPVPFGDVVLFGAGNDVFIPGDAGFDLRFRLEDAYNDDRFELPALPGVTGEFIASRGPGVSYGVLAAPAEPAEKNFAYSIRDFFPEATDHSLHIPFIASAFTGVFHTAPPPTLAPNDRADGGDDEYSFTRYLIVGDGDVASISDTVYQLLGDDTGTLSGRILEKQTGAAAEGTSVVVFNEDESEKVTQIDVDSAGRFSAKLRPGNYNLRLVHPTRKTEGPFSVSVADDESTFFDGQIDSPTFLSVTVVEDGIGRIPAKVTVVGVTPETSIGQRPNDHLYDLSIGEPFRYTDFETDTEDADTRRYVEAVEYTTDGTATIEVRPGDYRVFAHRGLEYSRDEQNLSIQGGQTQSLTLNVERTVDTSGYIAGDFHLHNRFSLDSSADLNEAVRAYAGEALDYVVSTDHNYVSDYSPAIADEKLESFIKSGVGLELTTIDRGHFNGFPLERGDGRITRNDDGTFEKTIDSRTYGSFNWATQTPDEIFDGLRSLAQEDEDGTEQDVIVQVNHARSDILGYFDEYGLNQDDLVPGGLGFLSPDAESAPWFQPRFFSWNFDAMEIYNGKAFDRIRNFTVPEGLPIDPDIGFLVDPASCCPLTPGEELRERAGFDCDEEERDCTCTAADVQFQLDEENCEDFELLFPGVLDDWFKALRAGKRIVGTGNSDTHGSTEHEPGIPRTYLRVDNDSIEGFSDADVAAAFREGNVMLTYGPFITATVSAGDETASMGGMLDTQNGEVTLSVDVQTPGWFEVDTMMVYLDGELIETADVSDEEQRRFTRDFSFTPQRDGFVIVEVLGSESMFPAVFPEEVSSLQFTDILDSVGGGLGLGGPTAAAPPLTSITVPRGLTNPVWLDVNGDGEFTPIDESPSVEELEMMSSIGVMAEPSVRPPLLIKPNLPSVRGKRRKAFFECSLPPYLWPSDHPSDARRVLIQFMRHGH